MLIAVLFAGQHTSSITSTWTGLSMLTHPVRPGSEFQGVLGASEGSGSGLEAFLFTSSQNA